MHYCYRKLYSLKLLIEFNAETGKEVNILLNARRQYQIETEFYIIKLKLLLFNIKFTYNYFLRLIFSKQNYFCLFFFITPHI